MQREPLSSTPENQMNIRDSNRLSKRPLPTSLNTNKNALSVQPSVPALTPAQMYSNFEEWIKMCTDNKVNATNTWNFALIDYFHEMTFIREGDSINFQKASCTLDGCVKIYTSRVDSVATETGKLLSGLADSSHGGDQDDENRPERRVRRKTNRSEATLLKDFSSIALKKFDLDFAVDPLFKKTSADFDEGGARGLLLNHLSLDQHCKIIFDASDATVECELEDVNDEQPVLHIDNIEPEKPQHTEAEEDTSDDDSEQEQADKPTEDNQDKTNDVAAMEIDDEAPQSPVALETKLDNETSKGSRVEVFRLKAKLPKMELLQDFHIVPFLKNYDFFTEDNNTQLPDLDIADDDDVANQVDTDPNAFDFDNDFNFEFDDADVGDMDPFDVQNDDEQYGDTGHDDANEPAYREEEVEVEVNEHDFLSALRNKGDNDMFNYFDSTLVKNWAGPEHWKLRRPVNKNTTENATQDQIEKPKKKSKAAEFSLDFDKVEEDEDDDRTFEPSSKKLSLSKDALSKMVEINLPDDIHFSSKLLLQYSLKPNFPTNPKKKKRVEVDSLAVNEAPVDNGIENPDVGFWADQNVDFGDDFGPDYGDDGGFDASALDNFDEDTQLDQTVLSAFEDTSYYQDNYDDPELSQLYGDELITHHTLKKTKPLYVNYARTAKRVDVKKLKDNLWKVLTSEEEDEKVQGEQKFTDIVSNLKKMYSAKSIRDISIPFCFICLLHLANEKDLSIKGLSQDMADDFVLGDENPWLKDDAVLNEITIIQN